jgi:hypothetical protein
MLPQQGRANDLRSIWSISIAPQLSGRHPEPVRLCEEHSRRVNAGLGGSIIDGSLSCHRLRFEIDFQEVSTSHVDNSGTCMGS